MWIGYVSGHVNTCKIIENYFIFFCLIKNSVTNIFKLFIFTGYCFRVNKFIYAYILHSSLHQNEMWYQVVLHTHKYPKIFAKLCHCASAFVFELLYICGNYRVDHETVEKAWIIICTCERHLIGLFYLMSFTFPYLMSCWMLWLIVYFFSK